jgi:hypothetical protein
MSGAGKWTLISPLASFRSHLDNIFFCLSLSDLRGGFIGFKDSQFKNVYAWSILLVYRHPA